MKYLSKLYLQIKDQILLSEPGGNLPFPSLLKKYTYQGSTIAYLEMGLDKTEETYIFIHGFGGFFMDWPKLMTPLSKKFNVIALDLPGWGFSEPLKEENGIEDHANLVLSFIKDLRLNNVTLVGVSYGAAVCWSSSCFSDNLINKLVLLNPMPPFPLKFMTSDLYKLFFNINYVKPLSLLLHANYSKSSHKKMCIENVHSRKSLDYDYMKMSYAVLKQEKVKRSIYLFARYAKEIDWANWEFRLQEVKTPTYILDGVNDKVFSKQASMHLHDLLVNSSLFSVEKSGHAMVFDQYKYLINFILNLNISKDLKQAA